MLLLKRINPNFLKNGGCTVKKIISLCVIVFVLCSFFTVPSTATESINESEILNYRSDFLWGQNMHTNNRGYDAPDQYSEGALHLAAQMGVKMIRYQANYIHQDFTEADQIIGLCNKYGIKVMLCLFPETEDEPTQETLDRITQTTKTYAERYNGKNGRGKVDYFQLWNEKEIPLQSAKYGTGATTGQSINNYYTTSVEGKDDLVEWTKFMKAGSKGIREADTDAKIVINFSWVAFGCIRYYVQEGVDFDIIGWDWYSSTFDTVQAEKDFYAAMYGGKIGKDEKQISGVHEVFPDKDVIICESNTWIKGFAENGGYGAENMTLDKYEPFFNNMKMAYEQEWIKAFCAFKLTNSPSHPTPAEANYGFIDVEKGGKIIGPKPIYYEYQKMIGGPRNVERLLKTSIDLKPYDAFKVKTQDDTNVDQNEVVTPPISGDASVDDLIPDDTLDEPVIVKPKDIYKETTKRVTRIAMPWVLVISVGVGMLVLFGAGFAVLIIIAKKKRK